MLNVDRPVRWVWAMRIAQVSELSGDLTSACRRPPVAPVVECASRLVCPLDSRVLPHPAAAEARAVRHHARFPQIDHFPMNDIHERIAVSFKAQGGHGRIQAQPVTAGGWPV